MLIAVSTRAIRTIRTIRTIRIPIEGKNSLLALAGLVVLTALMALVDSKVYPRRN